MQRKFVSYFRVILCRKYVRLAELYPFTGIISDTENARKINVFEKCNIYAGYRDFGGKRLKPIRSRSPAA